MRKKSLHSLNFFIRSSNQVGTSFCQQPIWYSFFPLFYTLLTLLIFVCTKIPQNFVLLVFFGRKNRQTSVLYQTDIVNKYLFFILFYKSQVIFPFCFFYSNTVFPTSVTPSGHYSVSKKIFFKCCTNKSDCSYLYCNVDFIVRSVVFYCESPNLL